MSQQEKADTKILAARQEFCNTKYFGIFSKDNAKAKLMILVNLVRGVTISDLCPENRTAVMI